MAHDDSRSDCTCDTFSAYCFINCNGRPYNPPPLPLKEPSMDNNEKKGEILKKLLEQNALAESILRKELQLDDTGKLILSTLRASYKNNYTPVWDFDKWATSLLAIKSL
jgi:hypothetical protein